MFSTKWFHKQVCFFLIFRTILSSWSGLNVICLNFQIFGRLPVPTSCWNSKQNCCSKFPTFTSGFDIRSFLFERNTKMPRDRFSSSSTPKFVSFIAESTSQTVPQSDNHPVAISPPPEKPLESAPDVPLDVDSQNVPFVSETGLWRWHWCHWFRRWGNPSRVCVRRHYECVR